MKRLLGLAAEVVLPRDDVKSHQTPDHMDRTLDPVSIANLKHWYREDHRFLGLCQPIVAAQRKADEEKLAKKV